MKTENFPHTQATDSFHHFENSEGNFSHKTPRKNSNQKNYLPANLAIFSLTFFPPPFLI
jgi:hypothetical protein